MRITQKIQEAKETKTEFLMYSFTQNRCPPNTQDKFTLKLILVYTFSSRYPIGWVVVVESGFMESGKSIESTRKIMMVVVVAVIYKILNSRNL